MTNSELKTGIGELSALIDKYGADNATKMIDCAQGVLLALKCFEPEIGEATLEWIVEIIQKGKELKLA